MQVSKKVINVLRGRVSGSSNKKVIKVCVCVCVCWSEVVLRDRVTDACMYVCQGEVMFCMVVCLFRLSK